MNTGTTEQCMAHSIDVIKPAVSEVNLENKFMTLISVTGAKIDKENRFCNNVAFINFKKTVRLRVFL